jgi:hypothetical protein
VKVVLWTNRSAYMDQKSMEFEFTQQECGEIFCKKFNKISDLMVGERENHTR